MAKFHSVKYPVILLLRAILILTFAATTQTSATVIRRVGDPVDAEDARNLIRKRFTESPDVVLKINAVEFGCRTLIRSYRFSIMKEEYPLEQCEKDSLLIVEIVRAEREKENIRTQKAEDQRALAEAENEANIQRNQLAAQSARLADVREGRRNPQDIDDLVAVSGASDGMSLSTSPKIRADGKQYALLGIIDRAYGSNTIILRRSYGVNEEAFSILGVARSPSYFRIDVPPTMHSVLEARARIGMGLMVIGKYVNNAQFKTIDGQERTMPVIKLERLYWWQ